MRGCFLQTVFFFFSVHTAAVWSCGCCDAHINNCLTVQCKGSIHTHTQSHTLLSHIPTYNIYTRGHKLGINQWAPSSRQGPEVACRSVLKIAQLIELHLKFSFIQPRPTIIVNNLEHFKVIIVFTWLSPMNKAD